MHRHNCQLNVRGQYEKHLVEDIPLKNELEVEKKDLCKIHVTRTYHTLTR